MASDREYYFQRAEAQLKLAERATDPAVARTHYALVARYLDRACEGLARPDPS